MPDGQPARSLLVPVVGLLLGGVTLAILIGNVVPTRARIAATQRALDAQHEENRRLGEERQRLEREAERLATDPWTVERVLRDEYRMSHPEELIVR